MLFGGPDAAIVAIELAETGTVKVHRREKMARPRPTWNRFTPSLADADVVDLESKQKSSRHLKSVG